MSRSRAASMIEDSDCLSDDDPDLECDEHVEHAEPGIRYEDSTSYGTIVVTLGALFRANLPATLPSHQQRDHLIECARRKHVLTQVIAFAVTETCTINHLSNQLMSSWLLYRLDTNQPIPLMLSAQQRTIWNWCGMFVSSLIKPRAHRFDKPVTSTIQTYKSSKPSRKKPPAPLQSQSFIEKQQTKQMIKKRKLEEREEKKQAKKAKNEEDPTVVSEEYRRREFQSNLIKALK